MAIRRARLDELEQLTALALRSKAHWGYSAEFMSACRAELTVHTDALPYTFVMESAGALAGFCAWSPLGEARAELEFLFVEPRAMGRGHGRALLAHAAADALRHGCPVLEIQGDPHAAQFYLAAGARLIGERASASIPGRLLPLYELRCDGACSG